LLVVVCQGEGKPHKGVTLFWIIGYEEAEVSEVS